ncbi:hypothetical protein SteCoe_3393 [Stentor coeruleus]|uniref:Uncharacterized protein n=1 Tax=Stentor coeruleus TaxID=5963 RepID=A0A1R2CX66_9CILI|nr:hypothetical protein SteCoe_3393 [Stentor coeruleus]
MGCACSGIRKRSKMLAKSTVTNLQKIPLKFLALKITRSKNRRKGLYSVPEADISKECSRRSSMYESMEQQHI